MSSYRTPQTVERTEYLSADPSSQSDQMRIVEVTCDVRGGGALSVSTRCRCNDGTPMDEYLGHCTRWTVASTVNARELESVLCGDEMTDLVARLVAGYSSEWNGNNQVGRYTQDATAADAEIAALLADVDELAGSGAGIWGAEEWWQDSRDEIVAEHGISGDTTDAQLSEIAAALDAEARLDDAVIYGSEEWLCSVRDDLRAGNNE